ncbi:MAG: zinc-ribbon domain-containing protein [Ruminococcaceae bacterium]|nr:zinc-ribbon domain-containing protein [Oscillospiraceae bacterium]
MFCTNCGRKIDESARYCPGCQSPVSSGPEMDYSDTAPIQLPMEYSADSSPAKNHSNRLSMIICAVAAALAVTVCTVLALLSCEGEDEKTDRPLHTDTHYADDSSGDDLWDDTTDDVIMDAPSQSDPETADEEDPRENYVQNAAVQYQIEPYTYYAVRNTPGGDGLVMRSESDSASENLGVLSEGSAVVAQEPYYPENNGYAYVYSPDTDTFFWVMAQYLVPMSKQEIDEYESNLYGDHEQEEVYDLGMVCYYTPSHAGVNVREYPDSDSTKLAILPEGTGVDIIAEYDPADNGYIYIGFVNEHTGDYCFGWALAEYIELYRE